MRLSRIEELVIKKASQEFECISYVTDILIGKSVNSCSTLIFDVLLQTKLELGVPRNTCVTCPGSIRKLTKGNNSKKIDVRVMDLVHGC